MGDMTAEGDNNNTTGTTTTTATAAVLVELNLEDLPNYTLEELEEYSKDQLVGQINLLEEERDKLKSSVNMNALMEYLRKDANYRGRLNELEIITEERNNMRREYENLRRQRLEEFMAGFGHITLKLKEMYQMITLGGDAELELVDSLDPFSEGIL
jgi:structural maintenance of chromosome 4